MSKLILIGGFLSVLTGNAFAQQTDYYIVRDSTTKKCTVTHQKPTTTTTTTIVNGDKVYKTETEAQSGMKTTKVCTD